MMRMLDPFSTGTLTFIRTIEMFVESAFATVPERFTVVDCFFSFNNKLKVIISPETKSKSESFMILFYSNPLNSAH
jgi:hypothetical protein